MNTESCVFCDIAADRLPSYRLYEDDLVMVILDMQPVRAGHCMVIPKKHYTHFVDLPDELAAHVAIIGNRMARKMLEVFKDPKPLNIGHVVHGHVPHVHYHVFPQYDWDDITTSQAAFVRDGAVAFDASRIPIASEDHKAEMHDLLRLE